uniref:Cellular communication network factor 1, like 1 n=1 Tax=Sinocyclocheilus grahami TaxID=75366 RepID=A0A672RWP8_SINGR
MSNLRSILRQGHFITLVLLSWAAVEAQRGCPLKCSCPSSPSSCSPGISSVLDSCGCCRVCARQFNQDCSPAEPCDHIKGLRCHLKSGGDPNRGLCRGKKCQRTTRSPKSVQIVFAGCFTARRYRPRSCGSCSDGRFCVPSVTRTIPLHFQCPEPERDDFTRNVMWIQRCSCSQRNSRQGLSSQAEFFNLPNDIHTYTH